MKVEVSDGAHLNVFLAGPENGQRVFLLHGFPESWWSWRYQLKPLADEGYRVIAPDLRGSGESEVKGPYDLGRLRQDAVELIRWSGKDNASGPPPIVIGHDWGGTVAWEVARNSPEDVRGVFAVDAVLPELVIKAISTHPSRVQIERSWYIYLVQVPELPEYFLTRNGAELVDWIIHKGSTEKAHLSHEELEPFRRAALRPGGAIGMLGPYRDTLRRALEDLIRTGDPYPEGPSVGCPARLLFGECDPALDFEMLEPAMHAKIHQLKSNALSGCGHFPHEERPDQVIEPMLDFLKNPV